MKKFCQIVLATVLSCLLVGQAFANAPEERILIESTKDSNWKQFLSNLSNVTMGDVKGYDPETDTIFTAAVLVWVCQNQAPAWKTACASKPERFTAFKARNGWDDTITGADLKAQGQGKGIFFPFAAPGATPVASVTPEQLKALETTFATAQTALMAKVAENAQAVTSIRQQLSAKETEIANLRDALKSAPTAEAMTALKVEIAATKSARDALKKSVDGQISVAIEAAGIAATKAAAPAANQAAAALKALGAVDTRLVQTEVKVQAVDGRFGAVDNKANSIYRVAILALGLTTLLLIGLTLLWRRLNKVKVEAVKAAEAKASTVATTEAETAVATAVDELKKIDESLKRAVVEVRGRVENLELAVQPKQFSFDEQPVRKQLLAEIKAAQPGSVCSLPFKVDGIEYELKLYRQAGNMVKVPKGIKGHQAGNEIDIDHLFRVIKTAIYDKNGSRIDPVTQGMPTLHDVVALKAA